MSGSAQYFAARSWSWRDGWFPWAQSDAFTAVAQRVPHTWPQDRGVEREGGVVWVSSGTVGGGRWAVRCRWYWLVPTPVLLMGVVVPRCPGRVGPGLGYEPAGNLGGFAFERFGSQQAALEVGFGAAVEPFVVQVFGGG